MLDVDYACFSSGMRRSCGTHFGGGSGHIFGEKNEM